MITARKTERGLDTPEGGRQCSKVAESLALASDFLDLEVCSAAVFAGWLQFPPVQQQATLPAS